MSQLGIYRNPLQVSPTLVARLDDVHLNELMGHLLPAQAYRCRCPDAYANANVDARDKGCDGWNARPADADRWLGETETCWQFKAGQAGEPARLTGEVDKPIPRRTLEQGGRFVLVASGSSAGRSGVEDRLNALIDDANRAGLPTDKIEVYGSEHLALWCNQHPAVASRLIGAPTGMWTLERWERSDEHRIHYRASAKLRSDLSMARLPNLLARHEIRAVLDRLLGEGNRRALYVVAVLTRVGWTEDKQQEGRSIAEHLGLNWDDVHGYCSTWWPVPLYIA